MIPKRFTYPFRYVPCDEVRQAATALIKRIETTPELHEIFKEGKMLGVLLCEAAGQDGIKTLYAFSGLAGGKSRIEGFVPPIFDYTDPDGHFRTRESEISHITETADRSAASAELQDWLFKQYKVTNAKGEKLSIKEVFELSGATPPGGTGECAAPKLLQQAYNLGYKPLAMGEFWYGSSTGGEVRQTGLFYPSCTGKCGPLLTWMMRGLDVEPNPLDELYQGTEPRLVYEDKDILVIDKPAGMLSVPGRTKANNLLDYLKDLYGEVYSTHRLDRDTSGLMIFARNPENKVAMEKKFSDRKVTKTYRARLVAGPFKHRRKGTIALPLALDWYDRPRQKVDFENGKKAITEYEVIQALPSGELEVEFKPLTGRSHQLRVHAASPLGLGLPIKGDCLYGSPSEDRLYLHASSIEFTHPATGIRMCFSSEPFRNED